MSRPQVVTVDLDNDGDDDILAVSCGDDTISFFANEGSLPVVFTEVRISTGDDCPTTILTGDMDNDGILDVITLSTPDLSWYKFNGEYPYDFEKNIITQGDLVGEDLQIIDFDLDGDSDIVFRRGDLDRIGWLENLGPDGNATINFATHLIQHTQENPQVVRAVDLDGDGDYDLVATSYDDDVTAWYENLGDGTFRSRTIAIRNGPTALEVADLDGDSQCRNQV